MDGGEVLPILLGALVAGLGTAVGSAAGLPAGYAVAVGLALAVPLLRAETFGGFWSGRPQRPTAGAVAIVGALVAGTALVALVDAVAPGLGGTVVIGVGAGGAFAGSYAGDVVLRSR